MAETKTIDLKELKIPATVKGLIEALIFAATEPLTLKQIKAIYEGDRRGEETRTIEAEAIREIVAELNEEYEKAEKAYRIVPIAGGYQFATMTQYADWIGKLYKEQGRRKLSQSGIETLAIVAYKQPVTKAEIEAIRGVNCDYILKTLLEKELATVTGRAETVGRPLLYGTTREFLKHFGLNEITDLPRPREIEEILGESQFETERRMLEAQAGAEKMKDDEDLKSRLPHIPRRKPDLDRSVEIVPRKKSDGIRTVVSERKVLEEAGQEKIEFAPAKESATQPEEPSGIAESTPVDKAPDAVLLSEYSDTMAKIPEVHPSPEVTATVQSVDPVPSEPEAEGETEEKVVGAGEPPSQPAENKEVIPLEDKDRLMPQQQSLHPSIHEVVDQPHVSSAGQESPHTAAQPKSKWETWKEKIQGFIKKIFA